MVIPICTQATVRQLRPNVLTLDPFTTTAELFPPEPRPPDPPPPTPSNPFGLARTQPLQSYAFTSLDAWWWSTLCRANTLTDDTLLRQTLSTRADYRNYGRVVGGPDSLSLNIWWARMQDRFYIGIQGTANDLQAMQFILTHAVGDQAPPNQWFWNSTFYNQAQALYASVEPAVAAAGAGVPLCVIGHSYGGAVAHILMWLLRPTLQPAMVFDRVVSFGAPRTFTNAAVTDWQRYGANMQVIRFLNAGDVVGNLPPPVSIIANFIPANLRGLFLGGDYRHLGPSIMVRDDGTIADVSLDANFTNSWTQDFVNYLGFAANPREHLASRYGDLCLAWYGNSSVEVLQGWASPNSLYTISNDLSAVGA